jgi:hypothetical protein
MNRWLLIRRMRGPAFLLLFGVTALLHEWHILSFSQSWPLYLVLAGVLALLERAAFQQPDPSQMPPPGYPAPSYPAQGYPVYPPQPPVGWGTTSNPPAPAAPGSSIVPAAPAELERSDADPSEGGR